MRNTKTTMDRDREKEVRRGLLYRKISVDLGCCVRAELGSFVTGD